MDLRSVPNDLSGTALLTIAKKRPPRQGDRQNALSFLRRARLHRFCALSLPRRAPLIMPEATFSLDRSLRTLSRNTGDRPPAAAPS
jgi:hypothetical protein